MPELTSNGFHAIATSALFIFSILPAISPYSTASALPFLIASLFFNCDAVKIATFDTLAKSTSSWYIAAIFSHFGEFFATQLVVK